MADVYIWRARNGYSFISIKMFLLTVVEMVLISVELSSFEYLSPNFSAFMLQFKWQLVKKASQVFYLHFALKKRAFIEEIHEKQEQVCVET